MARELMGPRAFFRMALWARRPPSARKVKIVLAVVALCLSVFAVERWIGWPEALTTKWERPPARVSP